MTLNECREFYYQHTGKASDVMRQLDFAGVGIVWMLKDNRQAPHISVQISTAFSLFLMALCFDLFQYLSASFMWGHFSRRKENELGPKEEEHENEKKTKFQAPNWINWPGNAFYAAKSFCTVLGYGMLWAGFRYIVW